MAKPTVPGNLDGKYQIGSFLYINGDMKFTHHRRDNPNQW